MRHSLFKMTIYCNQRLWALFAVVTFLILGQWRWVEMKGSPVSLFDGVRGIYGEVICVALRHPSESVFGILMFLIWIGVYVMVSIGVGWLVAAVFSAFVAICKKDQTSKGQSNRKTH